MNAPDVPEPDRSEPTEERKAELRAAYQEGANAPYKGVEIHTIDELLWIFAERNWSTDYELPEGMTRPNLSESDLSGIMLWSVRLIGASLDKANLREARLDEAEFSFATLRSANLRGVTLKDAGLIGATLSGADLHGATLTVANLTGAMLNGADFSEADLSFATLDEAELREATLSGADLTGARLNKADLRGASLSKALLLRASLSEANLSGANLEDAILLGADLSDADLSRTLFSNKTVLDYISWGVKTPPNLLGTRWNGAPLDGIDWNQLQPARLGDEELIEIVRRQDRIDAYRNAVRAYHGLVVALEDQGLTEPARRYRQRERALDRQRMRAARRTWGSYLFFSLLNLISGQGEEPQRIFVAYGLIISVFTAVYWAVSNLFATSSQPLVWYEALVLSLSSFHGRGFFPSQIGLGDPLAIVAAFEAVIGLFIELILIATFSNRFLNK